VGGRRSVFTTPFPTSLAHALADLHDVIGATGPQLRRRVSGNCPGTVREPYGYAANAYGARKMPR